MKVRNESRRGDETNPGFFAYQGLTRRFHGPHMASGPIHLDRMDGRMRPSLHGSRCCLTFALSYLEAFLQKVFQLRNHCFSRGCLDAFASAKPWQMSISRVWSHYLGHLGQVDDSGDDAKDSGNCQPSLGSAWPGPRPGPTRPA